MQMMSEGSKVRWRGAATPRPNLLRQLTKDKQWELYIPSELAYSDLQRGPYITPGAVLIFELELLKVKGPAQPASAAHELR